MPGLTRWTVNLRPALDPLLLQPFNEQHVRDSEQHGPDEQAEKIQTVGQAIDFIKGHMDKGGKA